MIVISVQLATVALFSIAVGITAVAPTALGLVLSVHHYSHELSLRIPSALTAAASLLLTLTTLGGVPWPYKWAQLATCCLSVIISGGSGLYYICERFKRPQFISGDWHLEIAFVVTWLVSLMASLALTCFCLGERWLATYERESQPTGDDELIHEKVPRPIESLSDIPNVGHLGAPVNFGNADLQRPALSPQLSWPSSIGSPVRPASFGSMRSVLDTRAVTPPPAPAVPSTQASPQHPKTPKSPIKLHLTKSSFSLRRSPSKNASQTQTGAAHASSPYGSQGTMPSMDSLSRALPQNGMSLAASTHDMAKNHQKWVIFPNENPAESRSVSGSSQVTGAIFPASEYNRKINSAGFQRDEPVALQAELLKSKPSFSQYDLERLHATRGHA